MNKALFLDLNGTLIEPKTGVLFSEYTHGWKFKKGILSTVRRYFDNGYIICIVTNQAGIDEGNVTPTDFANLLDKVTESIEAFCTRSYRYSGDTDFDKRFQVYVADSLDHENRKPNAGFANEAKGEFDLDLSNCIMVGDASGIIRTKEVMKINGTFQGFIDHLEQHAENLLSGNPVDPVQKFCSNVARLHFNDWTNLEVHKENFERVFKETYTIEVKEDMCLVFENIPDFSDSDKMFAQTAEMLYIDVDDFLNTHKNERN